MPPQIGNEASPRSAFASAAACAVGIDQTASQRDAGISEYLLACAGKL